MVFAGNSLRPGATLQRSNLSGPPAEPGVYLKAINLVTFEVNLSRLQGHQGTQAACSESGQTYDPIYLTLKMFLASVRSSQGVIERIADDLNQV